MHGTGKFKTVMFWIGKGKSKADRPGWRDDLIEWSRVSFSTLAKIAIDRNEGKKKTNVVVGTYGQYNG